MILEGTGRRMWRINKLLYTLERIVFENTAIASRCCTKIWQQYWQPFLSFLIMKVFSLGRGSIRNAQSDNWLQNSVHNQLTNAASSPDKGSLRVAPQIPVSVVVILPTWGCPHSQLSIRNDLAWPQHQDAWWEPWGPFSTCCSHIAAWLSRATPLLPSWWNVSFATTQITYCACPVYDADREHQHETVILIWGLS